MIESEKWRSFRLALGPLWWHAALVFAASRIGDVLNFYTGVFFLPAKLSVGELGAVDPVLRLIGFASIPLAILSTVGVRYVSAWNAKGETGKIKSVAGDLLAVGAVAGFFFCVWVIAVFRPIALRLGLSEKILPAVCVLGFFSGLTPVTRVILQGTQRFDAWCVLGVVDPTMRLLFALLFVPAMGLAGYLWGLTGAGCLGLLVCFWAARDAISRRIRQASYAAEWREILRFAWPVGVITLTASVSGFFEPFTVKHFLPEQDAAGYYIACRFGLIPGYLVGAIGYVLLPLVTHRHEKGEATDRFLVQSVLVTAVAGLAGAVLLRVFGGALLNLRQDWMPYAPYAPQIWKIGVMATLDAVIMLYSMHEMACRRFAFAWVLVPVSLVFTAWLYLSFGWGAARPFLPNDLWQFGKDAIPLTLDYAIAIMVVSRLAQVAGLAIVWRKRSVGPKVKKPGNP
ncbi:MAG: oligosaccharide flippase family protein [Kiritimatiellia bacterium]